MKSWCNDTQHNSTEHNETQHNSTLHNAECHDYLNVMPSVVGQGQEPILNGAPLRYVQALP
jgi:hypothetical protein